MTLTINGFQIDIQAALIIDRKFGNQVSFKHIYFARVAPGSDPYTSNNENTPCTNNPCLNDGFCVVLTNSSYDCLCTAGWGGMILDFTRNLILEILIQIFIS